jgi:ligand-binding sensor domain-containing protein/DNA-binding CsgD family transcriptional regulator
MRYRGIFLLLLMGICAFPAAQTYIGQREIVNYEKRHYNAGSQNWEIRQDVQGRVYFANNEGVLVFDGIYWKLYPLPNRTIVWSIEIGSDKRIYVGGQDEFGYFSAAANGRLVYTSLKNLLPEGERKFADIWEIVASNNEVFFRTNNRIFKYGNNKVEVYRSPRAWLFLGIHNNEVIAQDLERGLLVYRNGQWLDYIDKASLGKDVDITSAMPFGKDSSLVTVHAQGLFVLSGQKLTRLALSGLPIDPYQEFSNTIAIDQDHFIAGTYTNGFYLINRQGQVLENFSKKEGLQNSNVRSLFCDKNRNIWLGLDSGIDLIAFNNAIKHINPPVMNDGAGYSVIIHNDDLYFGLSNGIYRLPLPAINDLSYAKNDISVVAGGQTWGLYSVNNTLLAGKDEGFFQVNENGISPIVRGNGYWTVQPLKNTSTGSLAVAGNYHGVRLFESKGDVFFPKEVIPDFNESSRFLVVDNTNTVWVSHPYRGVYKIGIDNNNATNVKLYTQKNGLPSALNNHVYKVKNRVVIATERGVYEYNSSADTFEQSAYFKEIFHDRSIRYMKEDASGNVWFVQEKNVGMVDFSTLKPSIIYLPELKGKILSGFENIYPVNNNNIFVGGEKGFYHINIEKYRQNNHALNVYIRTVRAMGKGDSLLFGGYFGNVNEDVIQSKETTPTLGHQWNSVHIEYSSPLFEQQSNIEYSYFLEGFDGDWSDWSTKTEKDYTNLPAGSYTFKVRARNNLRNESEVASYSFTVFPPWYQTIWAYISYLVIISYLGYLFYTKQQKKLLNERQKHQEEQKRLAYLHQLELEKSEKEVMKLRNEKLESEIEFKNSELASTAMHLVQKESFLSKIKDELQHLNKSVKDDKADSADLKKILRILSEEEKLNEEWEQFSVHFNKVHSDFLIMLKEKYPALKAHELKLCAYLRMNLSSKEIAQLMSISVRGVEISRYRLRKKLQVPTETNLFQFLFDIHLAKKPAATPQQEPQQQG